MNGIRTFLASTAAILTAILTAFRAAVSAAAAVDAGRPVPARDLRRLGIDPAAFTSIGHG